MNLLYLGIEWPTLHLEGVHNAFGCRASCFRIREKPHKALAIDLILVFLLLERLGCSAIGGAAAQNYIILFK
jgi:hypothetical protein